MIRKIKIVSSNYQLRKNNLKPSKIRARIFMWNHQRWRMRKVNVHVMNSYNLIKTWYK